MAEEMNAWMRQGEHELSFARQALAAGANDIACYLGQQALEKYLKGLIILAGREAPRTQNLDRLALELREAAGIGVSEADVDALKEISFFTVTAQYPVGGEDVAPVDAITSDQAERTIDVASRVIACLNLDAEAKTGTQSSTHQTPRSHVERGGYRPAQSAPRTPPTKPNNSSSGGSSGNNK